MASMFRRLNLCSLHRPRKLGVLECFGLHYYQFNIYRKSVSTDKQSNKWNSYFKGSRTKYGVLASLTAFSLFLYSYKDKWLPTIHAIEKSDISLRKRFNFIADVVEKSADAVVCIEGRNVSRGGVVKFHPAGSGFIVSEDGLILTNAHVVMNNSQKFVQVKLKDGRIFTGEVKDVDMNSDLATVQIKAVNLPVMTLGSSSDLRAGEWVVAIGCPLSLKDSVSAGVVSSPQRMGTDLGINLKNMQYIQTDAAITFGNSGGPLVNLDGEAVGVNSMKVTPGISFAIPIEYAKDFLKRIEMKKKNQDVSDSSTSSSAMRSYLGISMLTLTSELLYNLNLKNYQIPEFLVNGVLVVEVKIGSPAFRSGLQPGDIVSEINGNPVNGVQSVYKVLEPGSPLNMKIFRKGTPLFFVVVPEEVV